MENKNLVPTAVLLDETQVIKKLLPKIKFPTTEQQKIVAQADELISIIRKNRNFSIEEFINRFSLSTDEGVAVMCLAESLLRIPDLQISKEFVRDKLSNKSWESFLFKKAKSFRHIDASVPASAGGNGLIVMVTLSVAVHPLTSVAVKVYVPALRLEKTGLETALAPFKA